MHNAANYTQATNEPAPTTPEHRAMLQRVERYVQAANESPTKLLATKREIAARYRLCERSIDLLRERGFPWIAYSPRKILFNVKECDAWFEKYAIRAPKKPSEYTPRIPTTIPAK